VEALALQGNSGRRVLVANKTGVTQTVVLHGLSHEVTVSTLDEDSFDEAVSQPEKFRARAGSDAVLNGSLELSLKPYAVACIDTK